MLQKIISGAQTGADRAALDAAIQNEFPHGGFCPAGRQAQDGPISMKYDLVELDSGYRQRTKKNVEAADGTVIFYHSELIGGSALTQTFCSKLSKPCLLVDSSQSDIVPACDMLLAFINAHQVKVLNVAGPSHNRCPSIYAFTYAVINMLLST